MRQQRVPSWWAQWTRVGGTCAPPAAPPRNTLERMLDRYAELTAPFLRGCYSLVVGAAVVSVSIAVGGTGGLWMSAVYLAVAAAYCLSNFTRCREAHCIITGIGWGVTAVTAAAGAMTGQHWLNHVWVAFAVIFVAGHGFEAVWTSFHGSNALRLHV